MIAHLMMGDFTATDFATNYTYGNQPRRSGAGRDARPFCRRPIPPTLTIP